MITSKRKSGDRKLSPLYEFHFARGRSNTPDLVARVARPTNLERPVEVTRNPFAPDIQSSFSVTSAGFAGAGAGIWFAVASVADRIGSITPKYDLAWSTR
jgi:hypothetical protein